MLRDCYKITFTVVKWAVKIGAKCLTKITHINTYTQVFIANELQVYSQYCPTVKVI